MQEKLLREKLKAKDKSAIEYLFDTYYEALYLFCEKFTYNSDAAHDIVQNVFVKIWENSETIFFSHSIKSYLFVSVKNEALQYLRSLKIRDKHNEKWALAHIDSLTVHHSTNTNPLDNPDQLVKLVKHLAEELPPQCRQIYCSRLDHGWSYKRIAEELSVSESVVKVQLHRATKKLRQLYLQHTKSHR